MKIRSMAVLATAAPVLALTGFGAPATAAQAQPEDEVAACVLGEWESTGVTMEHRGMEDLESGGGGGVSLTIDEDGTATADFTGMDPATFEGTAHDTTMSGYIEYRGAATGTVSTTDETDETGTLTPSDVDWEDVEATVVLTEPFASRPMDRAPLEDLQQMADGRGHMAVLAPVLSESTYECADGTLTLTSTVPAGKARGGDMGDRHGAEITWMFEQVSEEE